MGMAAAVFAIRWGPETALRGPTPLCRLVFWTLWLPTPDAKLGGTQPLPAPPPCTLPVDGPHLQHRIPRRNRIPRISTCGCTGAPNTCQLLHSRQPRHSPQACTPKTHHKSEYSAPSSVGSEMSITPARLRGCTAIGGPPLAHTPSATHSAERFPTDQPASGSTGGG